MKSRCVDHRNFGTEIIGNLYFIETEFPALFDLSALRKEPFAL